MLSPSGKRARTTLRKLPKARPSRAAKMAPGIWNSLTISVLLLGVIRRRGWRGQRSSASIPSLSQVTVLLWRLRLV